jgi:hypothetical protein
MRAFPLLASLFSALLLLAQSPLRADETPTYALPAARGADFGTVLAGNSDTVALYDYGSRSLILIIDFPSLAEQGRMFNRVGALVERMGAPRERVMSNEELAGFIRSVGKTDATFAFGNDFLVAELVVFFNLADLGGVELNPEEIALRRMLLERGLIVLRSGFFQAVKPQAVILSIPQETRDRAYSPKVSLGARQTILMHEISHAEFYTNRLYAAYCRKFWKNVLSDEQRAAFRKFLSGSSYNPDNEEMMINESQAYLLYTPDPRAFNPRLVGMKDKEVDSLRARFWSGFPEAPLAELRR